jgi:hypothetical protein
MFGGLNYYKSKIETYLLKQKLYRNMEKTPFTAIEVEKINERISTLEVTVMELRTPCYKKYALCIRISLVLSILIIIGAGLGAAFGVTKK